MLQEMPVMSSGGGGGGSVTADTSQTLGSITSMSGRFPTTGSTTEDCIMVGSFKGASGAAAIYINGESWFWNDNSAYVTYLGAGNMGVFVPKGSVITVRYLQNQSPVYNLTFYKVAN